MSPGPATCLARITRAAVRLAGSAQYAGPSSPENWSSERPTSSAVAATSPSPALTNTPQISARRRSTGEIRAASAGEQLRGLAAWKITPSAQAPSPVAASASASVVRPQILTRVAIASTVSDGARLTGARRGRRERSALGRVRVGNRVRTLAERHADRHRLVFAFAGRSLELYRHGLTRFLRLDQARQPFGAGDRFAVDSDDDVAADRHLAVFDVGADRAALDAGLFGGRALLDRLHERAAADGQVECRQRAVDRQRGQAEVGSANGAALLELGDLGLGGVDRHGEADTHAARARAAGLDLGVDADHLAGGVQQRTARVARVDRRIGLQHVVDREAVGGRDLPLQRRDHA